MHQEFLAHFNILKRCDETFKEKNIVSAFIKITSFLDNSKEIYLNAQSRMMQLSKCIV